MNNETSNEQKPKKERVYSHETLRKELAKLQLIGLTDIAKLFEWNTSKVATYIVRGSIPDPVTEISGRPVWHKPEILKVAKNQKWKVYEDNEIWKDKISPKEREERRKAYASGEMILVDGELVEAEPKKQAVGA